MIGDTDSIEYESSSDSIKDLLSDSDSDTEGVAKHEYTRLSAADRMERTHSHRIHVEQILQYEESEHNIKSTLLKPPPQSETSKPERGYSNRPRTEFLQAPEPSKNVNSQSSLTWTGTSTNGSITSGRLDTLSLDDEKDERNISADPLGILPSSRWQTWPEFSGSRPLIRETTTARMSISSSEKRYINQYLLEEKLGRGSFGTVRKCKDITTGTTYAMKILNKKNLKSKLKYTWTDNKMETSSALDSIEQEISIMKRLQHRNIVNLIEIIYSEGVLYLILEYMPHGSLAEWGNKVKMSNNANNERLRRWVRDIVSGLAYLHSQRICHSDIKPENILIGDNDLLKLADFGISRFLDFGESKRVFKEKEGTLAYQAPECLLEHDNLFSLYPTDIWALGVTLYQLRYGRLPFYADENELLIKKIVKEPVGIPMSEKDVHFIDLLQQLLNKDPSERISMQKLCHHPWITNQGGDVPLTLSYDMLLAGETGEILMSKLRKIGPSLVGSPTSSSLSPRPFRRITDNSTAGGLEPINEKKGEEYWPRLAKTNRNNISTRSLRGCQILRSPRSLKAEAQLESLVFKDLDISPRPPTRSTTGLYLQQHKQQEKAFVRAQNDSMSKKPPTKRQHTVNSTFNKRSYIRGDRSQNSRRKQLPRRIML